MQAFGINAYFIPNMREEQKVGNEAWHNIKIVYEPQETVHGSCEEFWPKPASEVNGGYITASKTGVPCGTCLKVTRDMLDQHTVKMTGYSLGYNGTPLIVTVLAVPEGVTVSGKVYTLLV